jgi:hypothetical protein
MSVTVAVARGPLLVGGEGRQPAAAPAAADRVCCVESGLVLVMLDEARARCLALLLFRCVGVAYDQWREVTLHTLTMHARDCLGRLLHRRHADESASAVPSVAT